METKNNEEMITVNGGCFPISWVRKFFNIETADIKDEAVTEAKLDPTLVSEIQQALKGLEITGDDSSGKITVTTTAGDSIDKALPIANAKRAGLISGSDYAKLQQSVNNVDVSVGTGSGTITVTQNNGTSTKKTVPAATEQLAGLMSASDKAALGLSFSQGSKTTDAEKVSLQLIKNDGDIAVVDIGKATETTAGVMTAQDKQQLNASTSDVAVNAKEATVEFKITTHGAGTATKVIPAATGSAAGVMTATDKQQLGNSVSLLEMQQGASQVDIQVTTNSGSHVTKTVPGATTDLAGLMTAADKTDLNATVKSVSGVLYSDKIAAKYTKTDGSTVELQIPAATTSAAGAMSAADKQNLDSSYSIAQVDTTADDVKLGLTANDSTTDTLTIGAATTSSAGVMSAADKTSLNALKEKMDTLVLEDLVAYGIERGVNVSSPTCTRVGNMNLHKSLPVQSLMRGCLLDDDGNVVKYLNTTDWTGETRDGSAGQVMVEIPRHWRKCYTNTDTDTIGVKISLYPLNGYHEVKKGYMSAYEASLDRTNNKLASVVNTTAQYRGGNNNSAWDGTYRSLLGLPATVISGTSFRTYARNRKSGSTEWNMLTYDAYKTLYWLYVIEYANTNCQAAYNAELTTDGYKQGGLGAGVTEFWKWEDYNLHYPCVPCGATDSLGNGTGVVTYEIVGSDSTTWYKAPVPRYRGIENPFGHIWKWVDGLLVLVSADEANGGTGLSKVYVCHDPAKFSSTSYADYEYVGDEARTNGYTKELIFGEGGEIMGKKVGAGTNTYYCDSHYASIPTSGSAVLGVRFGGFSDNGSAAGLAYSSSHYAFSSSFTGVGSRLCFIPA